MKFRGLCIHTSTWWHWGGVLPASTLRTWLVASFCLWSWKEAHKTLGEEDKLGKEEREAEASSWNEVSDFLYMAIRYKNLSLQSGLSCVKLMTWGGKKFLSWYNDIFSGKKSMESRDKQLVSLLKARLWPDTIIFSKSREHCHFL